MSQQAAAGESESCFEPYTQGMTIAGKYTLERLIGSGASGSVWMASHPAMGLSLALKIVHAHAHPDGIRLLLTERLAREARAAARIRHPAIVRVFDLGMTSHGDPFIAMELLHGETLRTRLQHEGRLSPEAAVALLLPIAAGLDAAHARGVVHRDIKPDNIVIELDDSGRCHPKLLDFGVAKLAWLQPGGGRLTGDAIVGTPEYMAPEQALGLQGTDHKVDIWSLSLVLYELVAGRVPFPGQSFEQVLKPIVQDPPPLIPGIDPELWGLLQRGLQKAPSDRFPSMHAMGTSLAAWLESRGQVEDISGVSLGQWLGSEPVLKDNPRASRPPPVPHTRMRLAYVASLLSGASMAWFLLLAGIGDARSLVRSSNDAPQPASMTAIPMPEPPVAKDERKQQAATEAPMARQVEPLKPSGTLVDSSEIATHAPVAEAGAAGARHGSQPSSRGRGAVPRTLPRLAPVLPAGLRGTAAAAAAAEPGTSVPPSREPADETATATQRQEQEAAPAEEPVEDSTPDSPTSHPAPPREAGASDETPKPPFSDNPYYD